MSKKLSRPIGLAVCFVLTAFVCSKPGDAQSEITLVATGSSLPEPLYRAWDDEYHKQHPNVQLRYLREGTAESGRKILAGIGDFGGGDAPNPEKELKSATVSILELPSVLIRIVIVYNLPQTRAICD